MSIFFLLLIISFSLFDISLCLNQVNFPHGAGYVLAAFGDFNGDQRTDVFMIHKDQLSLRVLLQGKWEEDDLSVESFPARNVLTCNSTEAIVSLIPGDFHGQTFVDIAVVTINEQSTYNVRLINGTRTNSIDCESLNSSPLITSQVIPTMVDFNGDMICDLLTYTEEDGAVIYSFNQITSPRHPYSRHKLKFIKEPMSNRFASAFVDVNDDGVADLVYSSTSETNEEKIYYYHSTIDGYEKNPFREITLPFDQCEEVGQSIFIDLNGSGSLSHLLPANCGGRAKLLHFDLKNEKWSILTDEIVKEGQKLRFASFTHNSLTMPIAVRAGDLDLDGIPELVSMFEDPKSKNKFTGVLVRPSYSDKSTYLLSSSYFISGFNWVASLLDLGENGRLDIVYTNQINGSVYFGAYGGFERQDTNFLKIMCGSGLCPVTGCRGNAWELRKDRINYGSNLPGPCFRYSLKDTNDATKLFKGCQLTMNSHFSLQTPYLVLGLGKYVNYVDIVEISIPFNHVNKTKRPRRHKIEQIVPDAQLLIIPRPPNEPKKWLERLYLTPGNRIVDTLYTLLGICAVLLVIIVFLHRQEKLEDAAENKEFKQNWLDRR